MVPVHSLDTLLIEHFASAFGCHRSSFTYSNTKVLLLSLLNIRQKIGRLTICSLLHVLRLDLVQFVDALAQILLRCVLVDHVGVESQLSLFSHKIALVIILGL